ncbi:MAG: hypothetical protein ACKV2T_05945 [Kofleriaceae bacterium]
MRLFSLLAATTLATTLLDVAPAQAEVRDHRSSPEVRDHRSGSAPTTQVRYRRRPGPRFMMPLKIDIGAAGVNTSRGFAPGIGAAVGIHWASLSPKPTNTDVGIGVFGALLATPKDSSSMEDNGVIYGGAYLELGQTLSHGSWWRTWAAARGEYIGSSAFGNDQAGFGGTGRLSAEIFASGVGIEPRGVFLGTYALGVYVEAGARDLVTNVSTFHVGGGITFRTPLVFSP